MFRHSAFRLTISAKILLLLAFLGVTAGINLYANYQILSEEHNTHRISHSKNLTEVVFSQIKPLVLAETSGTLDRAHAQDQALSIINSSRYGNEGYYWVTHMNGTMLAHIDQNLVGRNLIGMQDGRKFSFIHEYIKIAQQKGRGAITYYWPPHSERKKTSYVIGIPEWQWVIGTGIHVDFIESERNIIWGRMALIKAMLFLLTCLFALAIGRSISRPLEELNRIIRDVADKNVEVDVSLDKRTDEIGDIARTVHVFVEDAKRISKIEAEEAVIAKMKLDFISVVSHELRTPLTAIQSALGLVLGVMAKDLPEQAKHLLTIAHNNSDRLLMLANDILDIDMIASDHMKFSMEKLHLAEVLQQAVESNGSYATKFSVKLVLEPPLADICITVDKMRIAQVLSNLISNACKFSTAGSTVLINTEIKEQTIFVNVIDNGSGIPKDFQPMVFDKFAQARASDETMSRGSGLGLNICKSLIEKMGGNIGFVSTEGQGSTFWISMPFEPDAPCPQDEKA